MGAPVMFSNRNQTLLSDEASLRPFRLMIGCLVFVLTLVLTGTLAINHFIATFSTDLHENKVFEVNLSGLDATQHQNTILVLQQTLNAVPGVRETVILPLSEKEGFAPSTIFMEARVNSQVPMHMDEVLLKLRQILPSVHMQSHMFVHSNLMYLQKSLYIFSLSIILLISTTIIVAISLITKSGLRVHRNVIDILRLIGAPNAYISKQFQWLAFKIGITSSIFGVILGLSIFYLMLNFGMSFGLPHHTAMFDQRTFFGFMMLPVGLGVLSLFVARVEVFRTLAKLDAT
jgi:cell division transport system permease protein